MGLGWCGFGEGGGVAFIVCATDSHHAAAFSFRPPRPAGEDAG